MTVAMVSMSAACTAAVAERVARGAVSREGPHLSSAASIIRENVLTLFNAIIVAASVIFLLFGEPAHFLAS